MNAHSERLAKLEADRLILLDALPEIMCRIGESERARWVLGSFLGGMSSGVFWLDQTMRHQRSAEDRRIARAIDRVLLLFDAGRGDEVEQALRGFAADETDSTEFLYRTITDDFMTWADLSRALQGCWAEMRGRLGGSADGRQKAIAMELLQLAVEGGRQLGVTAMYNRLLASAFDRAGRGIEIQMRLATMLELVADPEAAAAATLRAIGYDAKTADRRARGAALARKARSKARAGVPYGTVGGEEQPPTAAKNAGKSRSSRKPGGEDTRAKSPPDPQAPKRDKHQTYKATRRGGP